MQSTIDSEEYEYAGFWVRFGATMIDTILMLMITVPLTMMIYGNAMWESESIILGPADFLINYTMPFIVVVLFWLYKSATPGKMVLKIKIVDAQSGGKLSVGQSIGRYLAYIPAMIPLFLGLLWVGWDSKKQGWHDKMAKTVVIKQKITTDKVKFT